MDRKQGNCAVWGEVLQTGEPVLFEWTTKGVPTRWVWMPARQWPPTADRYSHPKCFANERGVDALIGVFHDNYVQWSPALRHWRETHPPPWRSEPPDSN